MIKITVFTPTYNRANTILRAYESLLAQTFKDFIWLIIDDGSVDNTKDIVDGWIRDAKLSIKYFNKANGGKYTAMKMANEVCTTKYILTLDSDDALIPETIAIISNQWNEIEKNGLEDKIAEIRAYTMYPNGEILGQYRLPKGLVFIDTTWQQMVLKNKNDNELFCAWNLSKLKSFINVEEEFWLKGKFKYLGEAIYWARLGKQYQTRYLNSALRIYYTDAGASIMREPQKEVFFYNEIVGAKYFLDENVDYFFWRPKYFFSLLLKLGVCGFILKVSLAEILKAIHSGKLKFLLILTSPLALALFLYYKYVRKSYWG